LRAEAGLDWSYVVSSVGNVWIPKGIVKFFFPVVAPSHAFVEGLKQVAYFSCFLMGIGLFTRISQIVCVISTIFVISLYWSFYSYWSHGSNVQLLTALAFLFCRSGDRLSVDYLIRFFIFRDTQHLKRFEGQYWLPVLAAELAVHLFMFGAFFSKWTNGDGIWWALSDNLRNSLAVTWGLYRFDPPVVVVAMLSSPLVYKTLGVLQLFAQATTVLAVFMIHRPILRLIFGGLFFYTEIMGLSHVFRFWHPFWVPLCLISVDYEWFFCQIKKGLPAFRAAFLLREGEGASGIFGKIQYLVRALFRLLIVERTLEKTQNQTPFFVEVDFKSQFVSVGTLKFYLFVIGFYIINIVFQLGEKQLNYPFSSMAFYSENRDKPPYDIHKWYPIYRGWIELAEDEKKGWIDFTNIPTDQTEPLRLLVATEEKMRNAHDRLKFRYTNSMWNLIENKERVDRFIDPLKAIRTQTQIVGVPPYPQPALPLQVLHGGLLSVEDSKGFRGVAPVLEWDQAKNAYKITVKTWGFQNPRLDVLARFNVREEPKMSDPEILEGEWHGNAFYLKNKKDIDTRSIYSLIKVVDDVMGVEELYAGPENFQSYR
jgi:hypothetical protein